MPLNKFIPLSPDPNITRDSDMGMAQFGHLNTIVDYLNTYVAADSLQLDGTGPLSVTARYITDSAGNLSSLAISTGNIGIGTSTPAGKVDIVSDGGGQLLFSRYGGQPQINIRRSQGTFAAPTAVVGGASSVLNFQNYDGTSFGTSAQIQSVPENQTPTAKGASLALNVVQAGTTSVINGLIVSSATTTPGSVSITTNFSAAAARLSIWQTALSSTLPYFNIQEIGGGKLLEFSNAGNLLVGSGSPSDTARVTIKGSGSTSATTSLLVQNSGGTQLAILNDAGQCIIGTGTPSTHRLEVTGTTRLNGNVTCDANITLVAGSSVLSCGIIRIGNGLPTANIYTDNTKPISMFPTAGTESFRLFENGNLLLQQGGTFTDVPSSKCTINSTTQGFLKPRLTTAQKNAIVSPTAGLEVYDTDLNRPCFYSGSAWVTL